jgi:hypothetical protein
MGFAEFGVVLMADIVKRANVRIIQARDGFRFLLEALPQNRITGKMRRKDFDGEGAVQPRIPRTVHLSHPTRPERRADLIGSKFCARKERHEFP